jgi:histidine ammonia-lyase
MAHSLALDGQSLTLAQLRSDAVAPLPLVLNPAARARLAAGAAVVAAAARGSTAVYGVNTGFGAFASRRIEPEETALLQLNLVRSHACGVGPPLPQALVRRMLLLKANSLATGFSGVRETVVDALLALLNRGVLPVVPMRGSVGASGDLAPLAHLALLLVGEGEAQQAGRVLTGTAALAAAGLTPLQLGAKEGLAILNGTQLSASLAIAGLFACERWLASSVAIGALTVEALAGSHSPFDARIHAARGQRGQELVAAAFRELLQESAIHQSHADCDRVQDPYAVRCMPQVLGAFADTLQHARSILEREINAATDNPLVFAGDILSGGNFHAAPLGYVADFLAIALADAAQMSERRTDLLARKVNPALSMFLTDKPGLESGFMIAQVSAAALASSLKTLAHPASADTIPTSAGQEDHVSMAPWAGEKLLQMIERAEQVLAIEWLAASQALDSLRPLRSSARLEALHARLRERVPYVREDHRLDRDIDAATQLIAAGAAVANIQAIM